MRIIAFIVCIFVTVNLCAVEPGGLLDSLDMEVARSSHYIEKKRAEINRLKQNLSVASFLPDKYLSSKQLLTAYSKFNPDSAEYYSRQCYDYGVQAGNLEWQQEASLDLALIYILRCDFYPVNGILQKLGPIEHVSSAMQEKYALLKLEEVSRLSTLSTIQVYPDSLWRELWERYSPYLSADNYTIYHTRLALDSCGNESGAKLYEILHRSQPESYEEAVLNYALYHWLAHEGNHKQAFVHLIRSAMIDVRLANRDSQSMLEVIRVINQDNANDERQLNRLYDYTLLCTDNMRIYKDVGRSIKLLEAQKQIQKSYKQLVEHKRFTTRIFFSVCFLLLSLAFLMCTILWRRRRKSLADYHVLDQHNQGMNTELIEKQNCIDGLRQQITELGKDIEVRDKAYVGYLRLNVSMTSQMRLFKKKIMNQLAAGHLSEIKKLVSESMLDERETNTLYEQFDAIFLSIHPDFVERFNNLLSPECRIVPDKAHALTPELRIYALVCMGVADSISIAEYLQYSTQTIYNYRLKVRHAAINPDRNFDEAVSALYKLPFSFYKE